MQGLSLRPMAWANDYSNPSPKTGWSALASVVVALLAFVMLVDTAVAGGRGRGDMNLLSDPGFESGQLQLPFTSGVGLTVSIESDATSVLSGKHSLKLTNTDSSKSSDGYTSPWSSRLASLAPVEGTETFQFVAWAKANAVSVPVQISIFCLDKNRNSLDAGVGSFNASDEWTRLEHFHRCPQGTSFVSVRLDVDEFERTVWWDNLAVVSHFFPWPSPPNLLVDPGFESGEVSGAFAGSFGGTLEVDPTKSVSGQYSLKQTAGVGVARTDPNRGSPRAALSPAVAGETYRLSAWAKAGTSDTQISVWLFCLDEGYEETLWPGRKTQASVGDTWSKVSVETTCPRNARFISAQLQVDKGSSVVWWDHLWFSSQQRQPQLLFDPIFEIGTLESPLTSAARGEISIDPSEAHSGDYSLRHDATVDGSQGSYTKPYQGSPDAAVWPVDTPGHFAISAWVRSEAPATPVQLRLFCLDEQYGLSADPPKKQTFTVGTEWQKIEMTHECGLASSFVSMRLQVREAPRTVWWDDVALTPSLDDEALEQADVDWTNGADLNPPSFIPGQCNDLAAADSCEVNYCEALDAAVDEYIPYPCAFTIANAIRVCATLGVTGAGILSCAIGGGLTAICLGVLYFYQDELEAAIDAAIDEAECCYCTSFPSGFDLCDSCEGLPVRARINGLQPGETVTIKGECTEVPIPPFAEVVFDGSDGDSQVEDIVVCPFGAPYRVLPVGKVNNQASAIPGTDWENRECIPDEGFTGHIPDSGNPPVWDFDCSCDNVLNCPHVFMTAAVNGLVEGETVRLFIQVGPDSADSFFTNDRTFTASDEGEELGFLPGAPLRSYVKTTMVTDADCSLEEHYSLDRRLPLEPGEVRVATVTCNETPGSCSDPEVNTIGFFASFRQLSGEVVAGAFLANLSGCSPDQPISVANDGYYFFPRRLPDGVDFELSQVGFAFPMGTSCSLFTLDGDPFGGSASTDGSSPTYDYEWDCLVPDEDVCLASPTTCNPEQLGPNCSLTISHDQETTRRYSPEGTDLGWHTTFITIYDIHCGDGGARVPDIDVQGPIVYFRTLFTQDGEGSVQIRGIARDDEDSVESVTIYLDGVPVVLTGFVTQQPDPWVCAEMPAASCDSATGFSGVLDTSGLAPGSHNLIVKAVNGHSTPVEGLAQLWFEKSDGDDGGDDGSPPPAPAEITATDGTYPDRVRVSWISVGAATSYSVWRAETNSSSEADEIASGVGSTTFDDTELIVGQTYYYWIKAHNADGASDFSPSDSGSADITPTNAFVPEGALNVADCSHIAGWTRDADYTGPIQAHIYRDGPFGEGSVLATIWADVDRPDLPFPDQEHGFDWPVPAGEIPHGTPIYVYGINVDSHGAIDGENQLLAGSGMTLDCPGADPPPIPTVVDATDGDYTDKVRVTWSPSVGATSYGVWKNTINDSEGADSIASSVTGSSVDDTDVIPGQLYYYWVQAHNAEGWSGFSNANSGFAGVDAPPAPTDLSASDGDFDTMIRVTWNSSSGATSYTVYRHTSDDSGPSAPLQPVVAVTSFDDTSADPGVEYYYWVKAHNAGGTSDFSNGDAGVRREEIEFPDP